MNQRQFATRLISVLRVFAGITVAVICFVNIWSFDSGIADLPPREGNELVAAEQRLRDVRAILVTEGYPVGLLEYTNNRDLTNSPTTAADDTNWCEAQYVLAPWILVRKTRAVSGAVIPNALPDYILGDFWDGPPVALPATFSKVYDSGAGVMIFKRMPSS